MKIEDIVNEMELIKTVHGKIGEAISHVLGALKGEAYKAKKMLSAL